MKKKSFLAIIVMIALVAKAQLPPWPTDLYIDGGGTWKARVPVTFSNNTGKDVEGYPTEIKIQKGNPLEGHKPGQFRVVDDEGLQLKFTAVGKSGEILDGTPLQAGDSLHIPVSCENRSRVTYFIYYGNEKAWTSPDSLGRGLATSIKNGNFEDVLGTLPRGWQLIMGDSAHRGGISEEKPFEGKYCLKLEADPEAEPTWFKVAPPPISVMPGAECTITVQIRGENVTGGGAGWFIHVGNSSNSQMINNVHSVGTGTFDWKELKFTFKVPENADTLHTGPTLFGTGKAWFDNFTFTSNLTMSMPTATFGRPQINKLTEIGRMKQDEWFGADKRVWYAPWKKSAPKYLYRIPIRFTNPGDVRLNNVLATIDLTNTVRNKSRKNAILTFRGTEVPTTKIGNSLLVEVSCGPRTTLVYYMYTTDIAEDELKPETSDVKHALGSDIPSDQILVASGNRADIVKFTEILEGASNLIKNPSFEDVRDGKPDYWEFSGEKFEATGVVFGVGKPGGFGNNHAFIDIPADTPNDWIGWRQSVKVKTGSRYIYGGWMASENIDCSALLHVHHRDANGEVVPSGYGSAGPAIHKTTPWTPIFGMAEIQPGTETLQIHLTMNGHGKLMHDGIFIAETIAGKIEPLEAFPIQESDFAIWQVNPVVKVFREDLPRDNVNFGHIQYDGNKSKLKSTFRIALAQNEEEPMQIAVRSATEHKNVSITIEGLDEANIKATIGVIGYVPVDHKSSYYGSKHENWIQLIPGKQGNTDGWAGWWPDPIKPVSQFSLKPHQTQPLWFSFRTTKDSKPGYYPATILLKTEDYTWTIPFSIYIWNFTLPEVTTFPALYDIRWNSRWERPGMTTREARRDMLRFYRDKKICPDHILASPTFKYDKNTGKATADFTEFDKEAEFYFDELKFPVAYMSGFYLFGWAAPPRAVFGEQPFEGEYPWANDEPRHTLRPEYVKAYQAKLKLFMDHCREKGWDKKFVLYISDEPHFSHQYVKDQMKALCKMIKDVEPDLPIFSSTWRHCKDWDGYISLWGAGHYGCFPEAEIVERQKEGDKFWFTTDGQMCTDTPFCAIERLLPHYCFKYNVDAYEFWGATWLTYDPWKYGWHAFIKQSSAPHIKPSWTRYPAGDGYLIYPGKDFSDYKPVTSIRLEAARDGVDDHQYLTLLKQRSNDKNAMALLEEAQKLVSMPSPGGRFSTRILPDPDELHIIRLRIGEFLAAEQ